MSGKPLAGLMIALAGAVGPAAAETYGYDALGRVVSIIADDGRQTLYAYDAAGNRSSVAVAASSALQPPTAGTIAASYTFGQSAPTIDVNSYVSDPDGSGWSLTGVSPPAFGTASFGGTVITYSPPALFGAPQDTFTYSVKNNAGLTASGVITVALNSGLSVQPMQSSFVFGSAPTLVLYPLAGDKDPGASGMTIIAVGQPQRGAATTDGASVTYTPPTDHTPGNDAFSYTVRDGQGSSGSANITIALSNAPPVANNDSITVPFGSYTTFDPRVNDTDASGNSLSITATTQGVHGSTSFNVTSITYTAVSGYSGSDTFGYTISDGYRGTASATVAVTVQASTNHPPTATALPLAAHSGGQTSANACSHASDPDGDALSVVAVSQPLFGSSSFSGCTVSYGAPVTTTIHTTSFTYTVSDPHGATVTASVDVTVGTQQ